MTVSPREIDAVFDKYDEDSGGYMDEEEAKIMIKGLREAGVEAARTLRQREREAKAARCLSDR